MIVAKGGAFVLRLFCCSGGLWLGEDSRSHWVADLLSIRKKQVFADNSRGWFLVAKGTILRDHVARIALSRRRYVATLPTSPTGGIPSVPVTLPPSVAGGLPLFWIMNRRLASRFDACPQAG